MEQQRAINALEPFLALSKSANSPRAAADVIAQATAAPNTYVFAELLHRPNIHALKDSPEHSNHYTLLEIFAWGTWADYQGTPNLPKLSEQQGDKLRLLSLLPLARQQSNLTYSALQSALSLPSAKYLEQLVTKAIYSNLITGTLDPHHQVVNITSVAPLRDLAPGSVPALAQSLKTWSAQCTSMLDALDAQIMSVKRDARKKGEQKERVQRLMEEKMAAAEKEEPSRPKRGASTLADMMHVPDEQEEDAMDLDQNDNKLTKKGMKRGPAGFAK